MHKREKCCCFTGHRPAKLPWGANEDDPRCAALKNEIAARLDGIYETGCRHFIFEPPEAAGGLGKPRLIRFRRRHRAAPPVPRCDA